MNPILYSIYVCIVGLIRFYKWIEYGVLLLFNPILNSKGTQLCKDMDIILQTDDLTPFDTTNDHGKGQKYERIVNLKVNDSRMFAKIANSGLMGYGELYMHKGFKVFNENYDDLTEVLKRMFENNLHTYYFNWWNRFLEYCELSLFNLQTVERAFQIARHYDIGECCGYWAKAKPGDLESAQIDKMELIAKKLDLKPRMRVLDIGKSFNKNSLFKQNSTFHKHFILQFLLRLWLCKVV